MSMSRSLFTTVVCGLASLLSTAAVAQNGLIAHIPLPFSPIAQAINLANHRIYVAGADDEGIWKLVVVDGSTNTIDSTIETEVDTTALAVNPATNRVYVAGTRGPDDDRVLAVVDGATNSIVAYVPTDLDVVTDIAVNAVTNRVYLAGLALSGPFVLRVIDGATNTVIDTVVTDTDAIDIVLNPSTNRVYVASSGSITVVDGETDVVLEPISLPIDSFNTTMAINSITNRLYVGGYDEFGTRILTVVDAASGEIVGSVNTYTDPFTLAVNSATNREYVAGPEIETNRLLLTVVDGETDTLLSQRQIDTEPVSMVVDPGTDRIYIAGYTPVVNGATLTVYDGADTPTDSTPPVITVPASFSVEATSAAGAIASYTASAVDDVDGIVAVTCTPESGLLFHMLSTAVGCTAVDQAGNIGANSFSITVDDTTPPTIASITPSQSTLWPPNHALVPLTIAVAATDVVDPSPSCHIDGVASNQPVTPGEADWVIDGALALRLRSERDDGIERVYSIAIACSDIRGNVSHSTTAVAVRHNP